MGDLNASLNDYSQSYLDPSASTSFETVNSTTNANSQVDSGVSSIEKSKEVVIPFTPAANTPMLVTPMNGDDALIAFVTAISNKGGGLEVMAMSVQLQINEISNEMLDSWSKNLREMEENVRQLLNSPNYIALREIQLHGDPHQGNVAGVASVTAANASASNPLSTQETLLTSYLEKLKDFERLPPSATVPDSSSPSDSSKALTIPFMAAIMVGGAVSIGAFEMTTNVSGMSSTPFVGSVELVSRLQPILPTLMQDVLPMINLMVMPLIYFTSWDSSVGSVQHKDQKLDADLAQNFAKEVIKLVSDPAFIYKNIVERAASSEQLSTLQKEHKAAMLKLILTCVAASLLYSIDVGKTMSGKFLGMEPQEFKALLSGEIELPSSSAATPSQQLQNTLVQQIRAQLDILPASERAQLLEAVFEYFTTGHSIKDMTDPSKVFSEVLSNSSFNHELGVQTIEDRPL